MKRAVFILLAIPIVTRGQRAFDSLRKYSYLIVGYKQGVIYPDGTGFFYKSKRGYQFVTALHIFSEKNTFTRQDVPNLYDSVGIVYQDTVLKTSAFIKLDVRTARPYMPNKFFYEIPDIISFGLNGLKLNFKINSVEKLLPTKAKNRSKTFESAIVWGFGFDEGYPSTNIDNVHPERYTGFLADVSHQDPAYPSKDTLNIILQPSSVQGMSGSPAFFLYSTMWKGRKIKWIEFGGVLFGKNVKYKATYIVRPNIAIREMTKTPLFSYNF